MDLPGDPVVKNLPANAGDAGLIPGLWRSPREGNGNPLQYSRLGNPWTEEPGGLYSMGLQRVGHEWTTNQQQQTSYVMDYILYNAKIFSESFKPCLCLYCLLIKNHPDIYFCQVHFLYFTVSPCESSYILSSRSCSSKKGWMGLGNACLMECRHKRDILHCLSLLLSACQLHSLRSSSSLWQWSWLQLLLCAYALDQLTLARKMGKILWLAASIITTWLIKAANFKKMEGRLPPKDGKCPRQITDAHPNWSVT